MFTAAKQAAQTTMQQAVALGLAVVVTCSILAGVNGLASAPAADSLLASGSVQVAVAKVAANS